jgi:guanosine-3',5'-bis(diphosphate) 3'-pyrophosphohydrolase
MTAGAPDLPLLFKALSFAADHHRNDTRKGEDGSPYINHPIDVARRLVEAGIDDPDVLCAAILHDTVEDTAVTPEEIEAEFGPRIHELVAAVTDDKTLPKEERKRLQVLHASDLDQDARRVKIADKTSNAWDVGFSPPTGWSIARRREYLEWSEQVVAGCRGVNPALEATYDRVLAEARSRVEAEAAAEIAE